MRMDRQKDGHICKKKTQFYKRELHTGFCENCFFQGIKYGGKRAQHTYSLQ